jgi:hypothetical protein
MTLQCARDCPKTARTEARDPLVGQKHSRYINREIKSCLLVDQHLEGNERGRCEGATKISFCRAVQASLGDERKQSTEEPEGMRSRSILSMQRRPMCLPPEWR